MIDAILTLKNGITGLTTITDALHLGLENNISLNATAAEILSYTKNGSDLVIEFINGQTITLEGYFQAGVKRSLYLSDSNAIEEIQIKEMYGSDALEITYTTHTGPIGAFENQALIFGTPSTIGTALAELSTNYLMMGGAAALGALGIAALTGGSSEPPAPIDSTAPDAPVIEVANGSQINGTAEQGVTVTVIVGGQQYTTIANNTDGTWSISPSQNDQFITDETITATATDEAGNTSPPSHDIVDATPPPSPVIEITSTDMVSGTAEPGTILIITIGGIEYTATVNEDGTWSVSPSGDDTFDNGEEITIVATDSDGNTSTVEDDAEQSVDTVPPEPPVILHANANEISGTAEPGAEVTVTVGGVEYNTTADDDGNWVITPTGSDTFESGEEIIVTATDTLGNISEIIVDAEETIDATPPEPPIIQAANANEISGTAEAGADITVTVGGIEYHVTADQDGNWAITPAGSDTFENGEEIIVTATDSEGNTSSVTVDAEDTTVIDTTPPDIPVIEIANGSHISGTSEAGATITVNVRGVEYTTIANSDGNWSVSPIAPDTFRTGEPIIVVAADDHGNLSTIIGDVSGIVDATPPDTPIINHANGGQIAGQAEAGSTVIVTVNGVQFTTISDANNQWDVKPVDPARFLTGDSVSVSATDADHNISTTAQTIVDDIAPALPSLEIVNGNEIIGFAELGSTVTLYRENGDRLTTTASTFDGNYTISIIPGLSAGELVSVTATDADNNRSPVEAIIFVPIKMNFSDSNGDEDVQQSVDLNISYSSDTPVDPVAFIQDIPVGTTISDGTGNSFTASEGDQSVNVVEWGNGLVGNTLTLTLFVDTTLHSDVDFVWVLEAGETINETPYLTNVTGEISIAAIADAPIVDSSGVQVINVGYGPDALASVTEDVFGTSGTNNGDNFHGEEGTDIISTAIRTDDDNDITTEFNNNALGRIFGGAGDDTITGSNNNDELFGDRTSFSSTGFLRKEIAQWSALPVDDDGSETITYVDADLSGFPATGVVLVISGTGTDPLDGSDPMTWDDPPIIAGTDLGGGIYRFTLEQISDGIDVIANVDFIGQSFEVPLIAQSIEANNGQPTALSEPEILTLQIGSYEDTIFGRGGKDDIYGDQGNDILHGGSGADRIYGGDGDDIIYADSAQSLLVNGDFEDSGNAWTVSNSNGSILPIFQDGQVIFNSGDEAEYADFIEQLVDTAPDDFYQLDLEVSEIGVGIGDHNVLVEILDASGNVLTSEFRTVGDQTSSAIHLEFTATDYLTSIRITNLSSSATIDTDLMVDNVSLTAYSNDEAHGGNGDDVLYGGDGIDYLNGGDGDDEIHGGDGNDNRLQGGAGNDIIYGEAGNDTIYTGNSNGTGDGNNFAYGGDGNDIIRGSQGNDTLYGQAGNDNLDGFAGDNVLHGGDGTDTLNASFIYDTDTGDVIGFGSYDAGGDTNNALVLSDANFDIDLSISHASLDADQRLITLADHHSGQSDGQLSIANLTTDNTDNDGNFVSPDAGIGIQTGLNGHYSTVYTGDGNDTINAYDYVDPLAGNQGATLGGGGGNDLIIGSNIDDLIYGQSDDDVLYGNLGDDQIHGQSGQDYVYGGGGNDYLTGGDGDDFIYGGAGDDARLEGQHGNDTIYGGDGNDRIYTGFIDDSGTGNNQVYGGLGDDTISGSEGDDILNGESGNDHLDGVHGHNHLYGGAGQDTLMASFIYDANSGAVTGFGDYDAGADYGNTIDLSRATFDMDISFTDQSQDVNHRLLTLADHQVGIGDGLRNTTEITTTNTNTDGNFVDFAVGNGNQTGLNGQYSHVRTGLGNDYINATQYIDPLGGTQGVEVEAGQGNDLVTGSGLNDHLHGQGGNDILYGNLGDDHLYGQEGNDILYGGGGVDAIAGGDGDDQIYGGEGHDVSLEGQNGNDTIYGQDGNDRIYTGFQDDSGTGDNFAYGGVGNDIITGSQGDDELHGEQGNDYLDGMGGDNKLLGGDGSDTLVGRFAYDDTTHAVTSFGQYDAGDDGGNKLYFNNANFDLELNLSGTSLDVDARNFTIDDYNVSIADGIQGVTNIHADSTAANGNFVSLSDDNGLIVTGNQIGLNGHYTEIITGSGNDLINAQDMLANLQIDSGAGDDLIIGGLINDTVYTGTGNDIVYGNGGNDFIYAQGGDDAVYGGGGHDGRLSGGAGNDTIYGGDGNDILWAAEFDNDTLTDSDILYGDAGNDELHGDAGIDTLYGGAGNDRYMAGGGDDIIYFDTDDVGSNAIDGQAGTDTAILTNTAAELDASLYADYFNEIEILDLHGNDNILSNFTQTTLTDWSSETVTADGGTIANLIVRGDATNIVRDDQDANANWTFTGTDVYGGVTYNVLTMDTMTVMIEQGINITDLTGSFVAPIVIDLDGDGTEFVGTDAGIHFDINGDGFTDQLAGAGADDGVLVYDADGDRTLSALNEFVFSGYVEGAQSDLEGLSHFDTDGDRTLDADDDLFDDFFIFQDSNGNGLVDEGEFLSLDEVGITAVGLDSDGVSSIQAGGDVHVSGHASVQFSDGTTTQAADAKFRYDASKSHDIVDQEQVVFDDQISEIQILDFSTLQPTLSPAKAGTEPFEHPDFGSDLFGLDHIEFGLSSFLDIEDSATLQLPSELRSNSKQRAQKKVDENTNDTHNDETHTTNTDQTINHFSPNSWLIEPDTTQLI